MAQKLIRSDLYIADSDFMTSQNVWVRAGNTVVAGHPILRGREHKFRPFKPTFDLASEPEAPTPLVVKLRALAAERGITLPFGSTEEEMVAALEDTP